MTKQSLWALGLFNGYILLLPVFTILFLRSKRRGVSLVIILLGFGCILAIGITVAPPSAAQIPGEAVYYYHVDPLNTPIKVTGPDATVVWSADFSPYMGTYQENNPGNITQPLRYPGQYHDTETGLFYNMNRYYAPSLGRYVQPNLLNLGTFNIARASQGSLNQDVRMAIRYLHATGKAYVLAKGLLNNFAQPIFGNNNIALPFQQNVLNDPEMQNTYLYVVDQPLTAADPLGLMGCRGCIPKCEYNDCPWKGNTCNNSDDCHKWYNEAYAKCTAKAPSCGQGFFATCVILSYQCEATCLGNPQ